MTLFYENERKRKGKDMGRIDLDHSFPTFYLWSSIQDHQSSKILFFRAFPSRQPTFISFLSVVTSNVVENLRMLITIFLHLSLQCNWKNDFNSKFISSISSVCFSLLATCGISCFSSFIHDNFINIMRNKGT